MHATQRGSARKLFRKLGGPAEVYLGRLGGQAEVELGRQTAALEGRFLCQYLHFFSSRASKLSTIW